MARTVWKFPIDPADGTNNVHVSMPVEAEILHVAFEPASPPGPPYEQLHCWAQVDVDPQGENAYTDRHLRVVGTGQFSLAHPDDGRDDYYLYIGTAQTRDRAYVFHVYEVIRNG